MGIEYICSPKLSWPYQLAQGIKLRIEQKNYIR